MNRQSAVMLIGCNRIEYFSKTLASVVPQLNGRPLYIFLDKPNKDPIHHREQHLNEISKYDIVVSTHVSEKSLGLGHAMIQAREWAFDLEENDYAFILEDDMVLSEDYFDYCESLMEWGQSNWSNIGMVQGYQDHDSGTPEDIEVGYGHFWGYLQSKKCWDLIKSDLFTYRDKFLTEGQYKYRPHNDIQQWKEERYYDTENYQLRALDQNKSVAKRKILQFVTGQDGITLMSMCRNNMIRLQSCKSKGLYIGEQGEHFNSRVFKINGLDKQEPEMTKSKTNFKLKDSK